MVLRLSSFIADVKSVLTAPGPIGGGTPAAGTFYVLGAVGVPSGANSWGVAQGFYAGWNMSGGNGETVFVNSRGGGPGGFNFYNADTLASFTPTLLASISNTGNLTISGALNAGTLDGGTF